MVKMKNCVVRSYSRGYTQTTGTLSKLLDEGWVVKFVTPFMADGKTDYVEYILERDH